MLADLVKRGTRAGSTLLSRRRLVQSVPAIAGGTLAVTSRSALVAAAKRKKAGVCAGPADDFQVVDNGDRLAQTFIATRSGKLSRIRIPSQQSPPQFADVVVQILAVNGSGVPINGVLAQAKVRIEDIPVGDDIVITANFRKNNTVSLVEGTEYAIVVSREDADVFHWHTRAAGGCGGKFFFSFGQAGTFTEVGTGEEGVFTAFVGFP